MKASRSGGRRYSYESIEKLAEALDLELYFGPPRGVPPSAPDFSRFSPDRTVPQRDAFYVRAAGQSMQPEGINHGDLVLVSPSSSPFIAKTATRWR